MCFFFIYIKFIKNLDILDINYLAFKSCSHCKMFSRGNRFQLGIAQMIMISLHPVTVSQFGFQVCFSTTNHFVA